MCLRCSGLFARAEAELRERIEKDSFTRFLEDDQRMHAYVTAELVAILNPPTAAATAAKK